MEQVLSGEYEVEARAMLSVRLEHRETLIWEALCLNEMVLHREPLTSMCHFEVAIGSHSPVILSRRRHHHMSTPTGSIRLFPICRGAGD